MSALSLLHKVFPPPQYMMLQNAGVDISDTSLKYIQFKKANTETPMLDLHQWGDIAIPVGVVNRGVVHDVQKLTEVLKQVKEKCGTEYVRVSLPEERAYLFETTIKRDTPFKEIRGKLEFKLEENVPLSPRDAYFDYDIVANDADDKVLRIAVVVYAKDTINRYYEACLGAGLMPLSFEIEAQAIARASIRNGLMGTHMIVDFGKTRTGIGIVHQGALVYTSTIDIGGAELSTALKTVLGDRAEDEYTAIKNKHGLIGIAGNAKIAAALTQVIDDIKLELETRIHYWHTRSVDRNKRQIQKIVLCGGSSNLAGLPEYLWDELSIPTERAAVWQNAFSLNTYVPPISRVYSYGYATAVGLALKDFTDL